jgi:hypothetical protein
MKKKFRYFIYYKIFHNKTWLGEGNELHYLSFKLKTYKHIEAFESMLLEQYNEEVSGTKLLANTALITNIVPLN